jgi:hypothetical protein
MKRIVFIAFFALTVILINSCSKSNNKNTPSSHNSNIRTVLVQIHELTKKYSTKVPSYKYDQAKAGRLALADGVGGGIGASGGIWGALWGGFLTTLSLEPYLRGTPVATVPSETNSNLFDYGIAGDGHNSLMYTALVNHIGVSSTETTGLNEGVKNLLISTSFEIANPEESMSALYDSKESLLISILQQADPIRNDSLGFDYAIDHSTMDSDARTVIKALVDDMNTSNILDGDEFSYYLSDIETVINNSDCSQQAKNSIKAFLAVTNSSNYFWKVNYN